MRATVPQLALAYAASPCFSGTSRVVGPRFGNHLIRAEAQPPDPDRHTPGPSTASRPTRPDTPDAPSFSMSLLGFLLPPVGIGLWALCRRKCPLRGSSALMGAMYGVMVSLVVAVIILLAMITLGGHIQKELDAKAADSKKVMTCTELLPAEESAKSNTHKTVMD